MAWPLNNDAAEIHKFTLTKGHAKYIIFNLQQLLLINFYDCAL